MFDEQPDGDPHGECAAEIHRLEAENAKLRAVCADIMSVRDQFAKAAMTGCLPGSQVDPHERAQWAYRMADAMMRARAHGVPVGAEWPTVDEFAQQIRWLNGNNKMGAGRLAERLLEWLQSRNAGVQGGLRWCDQCGEGVLRHGICRRPKGTDRPAGCAASGVEGKSNG